MQHTYLRYECADAFGLSCAAGSGGSSAPRAPSLLAFAGAGEEGGPASAPPPLLSLAGSQVVGYDLRRGTQVLKLGHREALSGGVGTGRALNSGQVVCMDVAAACDGDVDDGREGRSGIKVATGWRDGAVRVFSLGRRDLARCGAPGGGDADAKKNGLAHSLLDGDDDGDVAGGGGDEGLVRREPLVLRGHGASPVLAVALDDGSGGGGRGGAGGGGRLASGSADGVVILWDVVAETGLFRLLRHRGPVTGLAFLRLPREDGADGDGLVSGGEDGLVKVWDLDGQCCVRTLAGHRGGVGCLAGARVRPPPTGGGGTAKEERGGWRLVTGCADGQVRVWSAGRRGPDTTAEGAPAHADGTAAEDERRDDDRDDDRDAAFQFMGSLRPPAALNMTSSNEGVASVHFHPSGRYVGVCRANDRVIEVYAVRSEVEAQKKRRRRLRRRREKRQLAAATAAEKGAAKKRGLLDEPDSEDERGDDADALERGSSLRGPSPEALHAMDEFEFRGVVRATHRIRGFAFAPVRERGGGLRVAAALATNALEVHSLPAPRRGTPPATSERAATLDMDGHPTGVRAIALSSEDATACTVSRGVIKIWNVATRTCLRSLAATTTTTQGDRGAGGASYYCLCAAFLAGNTHVVLGTREGHILIVDIASGDIVYVEEKAHDGAIWTLDLSRPSPNHDDMSLVTGSADKLVKHWAFEKQEDSPHPRVEHVRSLQMSDDVMCTRLSHCPDPAKRLLFVASLDSTIKVFFNDSLKFFLSLYGHKLPVLALDSSDDDVILASGGADKSIKIWGLDFGDTHRTLYGHEDSVTDLRFVRRTHYFFTSSKDQTVRFWDGDRFQQILLLRGHAAEVNCLALSSNGAFLLSGGMDRQVRVWERTRDIVFPNEEREREMEDMFDRADGAGREESTADTLMRARQDNEEGLSADEDVDRPQSAAAVKKSVLSVSAGDRIMEAIEAADNESKEIASFRKLQEDKGGDGQRAPNPMLFGKDPPGYVLWILRSVKSADLEQSLLVLSLKHVERLMHYLIVNLRRNKGVELCSKVSVFLVRAHQTQIVASRSLMAPLRELRSLVRQRATEVRDVVGFNIAALRMAARLAAESKHERREEMSMKDIWGELGKAG